MHGLLLLAFAACGDDGDDSSGGSETDADTDSDTDSDTDADTDLDTDADTDSDTDADSDTDTGTSKALLTPDFIGIDISTGYLGAGPQLTTYCVTAVDCYEPNVTIRLASARYFEVGGAAEENVCEFTVPLSLTTTKFVGAYNFDTATRATSPVTTEVWGMFSGTLDFDLTAIDGTAEPECLDLDRSLFPTGNPVDYLGGMKLAVGLGEITPGLYDFFGFGPGYSTTFIGINHPDGSGGVELEAYDWDYTLLYAVDPKTGIATSGSISIVQEPQELNAWWPSYVHFWEDLDYLDLSLMK